MIILDTHIWVWHVQGDSRLTPAQQKAISDADKIGIPAVALWEVAKAVSLGRLTLPIDVKAWLTAALGDHNVELLPLSIDIAVKSTQLPGLFNKDPFDQLIVATARVFDRTLVTSDVDILGYKHVKVVQP